MMMEDDKDKDKKGNKPEEDPMTNVVGMIKTEQTRGGPNGYCCRYDKDKDEKGNKPEEDPMTNVVGMIKTMIRKETNQRKTQ